MFRSWWKKVITLLIAILFTVAVFLAWTSYNFSRQYRDTLVQENSASLKMWSNQLTSRVNAIYEHIYELLITLYNNTELRSDTPIMNARTKIKIIDMMEEKLLVSEDTDAFFVYDSYNDYFLFSAKSSLSGPKILGLKEYTRGNAVELGEQFGSKTWRIVSVRGSDYLFKSVQLGKYTVGAVSSTEYYTIEDSYSVLGGKPDCVLSTRDGEFSFSKNSAGEEHDNSNLVAVSAAVPVLQGEVTLSVRPDTMFGGGNLLSVLLILDSALCVVLVIVLLIVLNRDVARATRELVAANQALASGQKDFRLDPKTSGSQEFAMLYQSFNDMAEQILQLRIEAYDMAIREEENKLSMLRAQIKPHSFLNAITTISNMTYASRPEEIRSYIASFARYVRYMLNMSSTWTTVAGELDHIRNYLKMQETRFPGSIICTMDCPPELENHPIPFLLLFTLVENSIKHAMTLYEPLGIRVTCQRVEEENFSGIRLVEEDTGSGFTQEALDKLFASNPDSMFVKEHLGLTNVRYTLKLIYHRNDLLCISNRESGGAHIEIRIPDQEENS